MSISLGVRGRGFTLIELLVVIAIIGLLASIVLASLNTARSKASDAAIISDVKSLESALELYYNDYGGYPTSNTTVNGDVPFSDTTLTNKHVPKYIGSMPKPLVDNTTDHYYAGGATTGVGRRYDLHIFLSGGVHCLAGLMPQPGDWGETNICGF